MIRLKILAGILLLACYKVQSQPLSTSELADDFKKLIVINSNISWTTFDNKEGAALYNSATVAQLIEITAPYVNSNAHNVKSLCWSLLGNALFKKTISEAQKQQIVEMFCRNYFHTNYDLEMIETCLRSVKEKDFNANAKKYVAALADSLHTFNSAACAKILAVAQIKKSIPALWKIVDTDITDMRLSQLEILASLARMGEQKAAALLCNYYNSKRVNPGYRHISLSIPLAFSLDKSVLDCLVADYKTIDSSIHYRDVDVFICPTCNLGLSIVSMIKNYPYTKTGFSVNPGELREWLDKSPVIEMEGK